MCEAEHPYAFSLPFSLTFFTFFCPLKLIPFRNHFLQLTESSKLGIERFT